MPVFEVKNLTYHYDKYENVEQATLENISFEVMKGDIVSIIGKSGSGKSTLISHLNGILKADSGEIFFNGENIYSKEFDLTKLRFKCGVVFQYPEYQLFSETVIDDVSFGNLKKGLSKDTAYEKSIEVLKQLNILELKDEIPFNLSGGEKRKVAFAGVFSMEPEVLIFDEPEAGLDPISKVKFFDFILDLNKKYNTTILFITHDLDDALEYSNKTILINDGKLIKTGNTIDIMLDENLMNMCNLESPTIIKVYKRLHDINNNFEPKSFRYQNFINSIVENFKC